MKTGQYLSEAGIGILICLSEDLVGSDVGLGINPTGQRRGKNIVYHNSGQLILCQMKIFRTNYYIHWLLLAVDKQ